jgi:hypothetical protein
MLPPGAQAFGVTQRCSERTPAVGDLALFLKHQLSLPESARRLSQAHGLAPRRASPAAATGTSRLSFTARR